MFYGFFESLIVFVDELLSSAVVEDAVVQVAFEVVLAEHPLVHHVKDEPVDQYWLEHLAQIQGQ